MSEGREDDERSSDLKCGVGGCPVKLSFAISCKDPFEADLTLLMPFSVAPLAKLDQKSLPVDFAGASGTLGVRECVAEGSCGLLRL